MSVIMRQQREDRGVKNKNMKQWKRWIREDLKRAGFVPGAGRRASVRHPVLVRLSSDL